MTNFVNIRLPDNLLIDPQLKPLVDKLAMNNPKWVFAPTRRGSNYKQGVEVTYRMSEETRAKHTAPDDFSFIRAMQVSQDGEQLGVVFVDTTYSRRVDQSWHYGVTSWRIEKSRGTRNTTYSTKLDMTIRNVKKTFKPMDHTETYVKAYDAVTTGFVDASRNLMDPIRSARLIKGVVGLQAYALAKALGEPVESADLLEIEKQLKSESFIQSMGEYNLAKTVVFDSDSNKLRVVVAMGGNQYLYKDAQMDLVCKDFETLSERMQNNVSVMQLMQDNEIVRDVGYKYNTTHFYVYM
jgi:hypothetical protein